MAQVYPFPAFRYNAGKVSYDRVLTQPYDKISPAMQDKYYAADPHNLIAIEKGLTLPGDTPGRRGKRKKRLHPRRRRAAKMDPRAGRRAGHAPVLLLLHAGVHRPRHP